MESLKRAHANNVAVLRKSPLAEISGSLGDLGTLLPLMIALAINNSISLSTTLVFSGLWNVLTGVVFGIPLPVQPMKAIAAVAIARKFSIEETISAGLTTSIIVLFFSVTGLLRWFTHAIPTPVVKGIQVGAGLSLVLSAGSSLLQPLGWTTPSPADNLIWVIFAFLALLLTTTTYPKIPYALLIFLLGLVFAFYLTPLSSLPALQLWDPQTYVPSRAEFRNGALSAGLGQVPLTTLNSIIAVSYLSADLLPHLPTPTVTAIGISVAAMNIIAAPLGAMPVCHGSGGLAAQYRFGARSGSSIIMLGLFKIILGLFFGSSLIELLQSYPKSLLGVMVFAAGLELASVGESLNWGARDLWEAAENRTPRVPDVDDGYGLHDDEEVTEVFEGVKRRELSGAERKERWMVMFMTVGGLLAFRNDGVGFIAGMLCHAFYRAPGAWSGLRARSTRASRASGGRDTRWDNLWARASRREEEEEGLLSGDRRDD